MIVLQLFTERQLGTRTSQQTSGYGNDSDGDGTPDPQEHELLADRWLCLGPHPEHGYDGRRSLEGPLVLVGSGDAFDDDRRQSPLRHSDRFVEPCDVAVAVTGRSSASLDAAQAADEERGDEAGAASQVAG